MLKILKQPEMHTRDCTKSGITTVRPSLYGETWHDAVRYAAAETGIAVGDFPAINPWESWEWVLNEYAPPQPPVPPLRPVRKFRKAK